MNRVLTRGSKVKNMLVKSLFIQKSKHPLFKELLHIGVLFDILEYRCVWKRELFAFNIQAVAIGFLVNQQKSEWLNVREELARKKEASQRGRKSSTEIITNATLN